MMLLLCVLVLVCVFVCVVFVCFVCVVLVVCCCCLCRVGFALCVYWVCSFGWLCFVVFVFVWCVAFVLMFGPFTYLHTYLSGNGPSRHHLFRCAAPKASF